MSNSQFTAVKAVYFAVRCDGLALRSETRYRLLYDSSLASCRCDKVWEGNAYRS